MWDALTPFCGAALADMIDRMEERMTSDDFESFLELIFGDDRDTKAEILVQCVTAFRKILFRRVLRQLDLMDE